MSSSAPASADQRRMYDDLVWTWPIISPKEDYVEEAGEFRSLFLKHSQAEVRTLLHLGCGGGHLDYTLKRYFELGGVDLSEGMLALARELNPEVSYHQGDMRTVRLDQAFDAVMVADSIDYMLTEADLRAAFATAYAHLRPGGVFCTYAEETRERFQQHGVHHATHKRGDVEITLIEHYYDPDPSDTVYEMVFVYLVRRAGQLELYTDRHLGGLFAERTWLELLRQVGFEARRVQLAGGEIPSFVGIKPPAL